MQYTSAPHSACISSRSSNERRSAWRSTTRWRAVPDGSQAPSSRNCADAASASRLRLAPKPQPMTQALSMALDDREEVFELIVVGHNAGIVIAAAQLRPVAPFSGAPGQAGVE